VKGVNLCVEDGEGLRVCGLKKGPRGRREGEWSAKDGLRGTRKGLGIIGVPVVGRDLGAPGMVKSTKDGVRSNKDGG
jgi:hypothetical protein